mmetsp:Transcript_1904/g.4030  ORF Transcript_1904/g.4030 Transcript_1904/m.4030 type:complete len:207 (-) Transcript_1904:775-1395(-)
MMQNSVKSTVPLPVVSASVMIRVACSAVTLRPIFPIASTISSGSMKPEPSTSKASKANLTFCMSPALSTRPSSSAALPPCAPCCWARAARALAFLSLVWAVRRCARPASMISRACTALSRSDESGLSKPTSISTTHPYRKRNPSPSLFSLVRKPLKSPSSRLILRATAACVEKVRSARSASAAKGDQVYPPHTMDANTPRLHESQA